MNGCYHVQLKYAFLTVHINFEVIMLVSGTNISASKTQYNAENASKAMWQPDFKEVFCKVSLNVTRCMVNDVSGKTVT